MSFGNVVLESLNLSNSKLDTALFINTTIQGDLRASETRVKSGVLFFNSRIGGYVDFLTLSTPFLVFDETEFDDPESQEEACRKAKIILEEMGDRELSDEYFYREMDAKRRQKGTLTKYLELIAVQ